jgi:hypothetical protein
VIYSLSVLKEELLYLRTQELAEVVDELLLAEAYLVGSVLG